MQYLDFNNDQGQRAIRLTQYVLLLLGCILLWFMPATHKFCVYLDEQAFYLLNGSLNFSHAWQLFWGYLNHPNESWLNVVAMAAINIIGIYSLPSFKRGKAFIAILYFWAFFQLVLLVTHTIFADILSIQRASPSLILNPVVVLSETLDLPTLKVASSTSFPAGHALVAIFWCKFSMLYCRPWVQKIILITTFLLILPRLFSGAHWLSDILFTSVYALVCFAIAISIPLFATITGLKRQKVGAL